jgi:CDP-glycerol glycerophosphotransferase (TagB/SpsB family)
MTHKKLEFPMPAGVTVVFDAFHYSCWHHQNAGAGQSLLIYTYSFEVGPKPLAWVISPFAKLVFEWQTRRRFARLRKFLSLNAADMAKWQIAQSTGSNG